LRARRRALEPVDARAAATDLAGDARRLIELEVRLFKAETLELAVLNMIAAGLMATGMGLITIALLVALPFLVVTALPWHAAAAGVFLALYVLAGTLLAFAGVRKLEPHPWPARTIASLRETLDWTIEQCRSRL
jgi:uncharacterized membrane protein YqjE